jgi:O-antigen/teichoic acid export membrane protein
MHNAGTSIVRVVFCSGLLFALYRYLLDTIGVQQLGVWSIVLATTTVTRLSGVGLSGSVVKFVAQYAARDDMVSVSRVVQTTVLSVAFLLGVVLIAAAPVLRWYIARVIPEPSLLDAFSLLPYSLISLWLMTIGGIFQDALDGLQRIDIRNLLMIGSSAVYLLLTIGLVPTYGLLGLAYGQIAQATILLVVSWCLLRRLLPIFPLIPYRWQRTLFGEMIRYGVNFQIVTLVGMLFDPMTKGLMSSFGGLAMVGYYELASRMVGNLRALLLAGNQVLVPVFADLQERTPERVGHVYRASYRLLMYLVLPFYGGVMAAIPLISVLWLGDLQTTFMIFAFLLTFGYGLNTMAMPAYFANLGTGRLQWNTVGYATMGGLNGALGFVFGEHYGGVGVSLAWVVALVLGSAVIVLAYHMEHRISLPELFPSGNRWLLVASSAGILASGVVSYQLHERMSVTLLGVVGLSTFVGAVFAAVWLHPMRATLMRWVEVSILKADSSRI